MRISRVVFLGSLLVAGPALAEPQPRERLPIVDRAIAFHGGELYRSSTTELDLCSKSGCFHVRATIDGGRYEVTVAGKSGGRDVEVRMTNDSVEVRQDGEPVDVAGDEQRHRDFAMARVYFPFLPYRLNDPGVFKQDLGIVDWNGRRLHKVKVTFTLGSSTDADDEYMYWLDPDTGRVELFAYSYRSGGPGLRFRRAFGHRRIGGILFFDQENYGVEGGGLGVDDVGPSFVEEKMRRVSTVRLENIRVNGK
ncbi:MAG: DUF6503 family protein [Thermoanaerobaculia bacterium]